MACRACACWVLFALVLSAGGVARAQSCPHGIIERGMTTAEVMLACGDPTLWDQRLIEVDLRDDDGIWYHVSRTIDEWTYDLGPNRLVRVMTFKNGVLTRVASGGYGPVEPAGDRDRVGIVHVGQTRSQVTLAWGSPHFAEQHERQRTWLGPRRTVVQRTVTLDTWTYDFGPNRLVRVLTFEDGKLVAIRTGTRGQALPEPEDDPDAADAED